MLKISKAELIELQKRLKTDRAISKELGISPLRVFQLRTAFKIPSSLAGNEQRNAKILALREKGATVAFIANKMKLSDNHIFRILRDSKIALKKKE